ncbi:glutamine synthetase, partial [Pseudomonas frederiksbergensis]|nr:glutamine synthetase [Pseudomonas frederiksbergensis]
MKSRCLFAFAVLLQCEFASANTTPLSNGLALCTRSATLLACSDAQGNYYSVQTQGNTTYLRGFEMQGRRLWAQTNSRYGQ